MLSRLTFSLHSAGVASLPLPLARVEDACVLPLSHLASQVRASFSTTSVSSASSSSPPAETAATGSVPSSSSPSSPPSATVLPSKTKSALKRELNELRKLLIVQLRKQSIERLNPSVPRYVNSLTKDFEKLAPKILKFNPAAAMQITTPGQALKFLKQEFLKRKKAIKKGQFLSSTMPSSPSEMLAIQPRPILDKLKSLVTYERQAWVIQPFFTMLQNSGFVSQLRQMPLMKRRFAFPASYRSPAETRSLINVSDHVFGAPPRIDIMHRAVIWYRACIRAGLASTKTRGEVRGGGRKPRPQKRTGRSRQGSIRSPLWPGGGIVFGPKPRDFGYHLPHSVRRLALRTALSTKFAEGNLIVVNTLNPPYSDFSSLVHALRCNDMKSALLVDVTVSGALEMHQRPLERRSLKPVKVTDLTVFHILKYEKLVLSVSALNWLQDYFHLHLVTRKKTRRIVLANLVQKEREIHRAALENLEAEQRSESATVAASR